MLSSVSTFVKKVCCTKKPPLLHRALDEHIGEEGDEQYDTNIKLIEDLVTKRRVKKKDKFKRNALHIACMNQPTLDLVQILVETYHEAVEEPDKVGRLPLHTACSNMASLQVIQYLLDQFPESIYETTDRGTTALFCAIEGGQPLHVVRYLVEKDPEAVNLDKYRLGKTPVHAAVGRNAPFSVVQYLVKLRPKACSEKDAWGKTPLACACACNAAENDDDANATAVLAFLLDATRVREPDRAGMLPLHIACANNASIKNIEMIMNEYSQAIAVTDNNGRLPFHAACTNTRVSIELIDTLHTAYPPALKTFDKQGTLPLHLAIQRKLPTDVIMYLINLEHGAARTMEASSKMYALHMAVKTMQPKEILELLVKIYPKAISAKDKDGNTVFHICCTARQVTGEYCELVLDTIGGMSHLACRELNSSGMLPIHLALMNRAPWDVIEMLIDQYPQGLLMQDNKGNLPLHKAFQTTTDMTILVRIAQEDRRQLLKKNKKKLTPTECVSETFEKQFNKARFWYNLRKAYCPICIRDITPKKKEEEKKEDEVPEEKAPLTGKEKKKIENNKKKTPDNEESEFEIDLNSNNMEEW